MLEQHRDVSVRYPSPQDPAGASVWDNYVVAQASQAALGLIPSSALAVGVEIEGSAVRLRYQLSDVTDQDVTDLGSIADELAMLLGDDVRVETATEVLDHRKISPHDGVRWIFLSRA